MMVGANTLIIDKRTPTISADPEEHFKDHFFRTGMATRPKHLATYTGKIVFVPV